MAVARNQVQPDTCSKPQTVVGYENQNKLRINSATQTDYLELMRLMLTQVAVQPMDMVRGATEQCNFKDGNILTKVRRNLLHRMRASLLLLH